MKEDFDVINNPESTDKVISNQITIYRNKPITPAIEPLLNVLKNENRGEETRVLAAEVLGWYNLHFEKTNIIKELKAFKTSNKKVMNEVKKTINRLECKNR
jgi:hypothetical protein